MPWLATATVVGVVVLAVLVWVFLRTRSQDLLEEMAVKHRQNSKLTSRANLVQGMEKFPVVLSLKDDAIAYQNFDVDALLELNRIEEIEYDDELLTGRSIAAGCRALRLRSHGAAFEFILEPPDCNRWMAALPARRYDAAARAV